MTFRSIKKGLFHNIKKEKLNTQSILESNHTELKTLATTSPAQVNFSRLLPYLEVAVLKKNENSTHELFVFQNKNEAVSCFQRIMQLIEKAPGDIEKAIVASKDENQLINYQFALQDAEYQALRLAIRKNAPNIKPMGDFFYKSLIAEPYRCYVHRFIEGLILGKKLPKRIGEKKETTVTGSGVYLRHPDTDSHLPFKKPQYSALEKKGSTNFQSTSIGMEDFFSKVFSFKDKKRVSAGPVFEKHAVLLSERLFMYLGPTVNRSYDFVEINSGESYFKHHHQKNLFSKAEFEAFKAMVRRYPKKYSEPLVRLKWLLDGTCKFFIGSDDLYSRLVAKQYADSLLLELKKANLCPPHYYVPIFYYTPEVKELLYKEYTQEEFQLDRLLANKIAHDIKLRQSEYQNNHFEFLLALSPDTIHPFLSEDINGIPLAIYLLKNGFEHIYRFLLEKTAFDLKAMLNTVKDGGVYAKEILPHAIRSGDLSLVTTLLQYQLNMGTDDFHKLVITALEKHLPDIANVLISSQLYQNASANHINQALYLASKIGDKNLVHSLLDKQANVNAIGIKSHNGTEDNETPLMLAAYYGHTEIVELLLARGANPEIKNKKGHTALSIAVYRGKIQTVLQLLLHQAYINTKDNNGNTPLLLALYCEYKDIVSLLINYKADINLTNAKGNTPLHQAVFQGDIEVIQFLLENGVDIAAKPNKDGITPLMMAVKFNRIDAALMLIANGADFDEKNENNQTALDIAIKYNRKQIINFIKSYTGIQKLWQQAAIESNENNTSIAYQLSRLFKCYASSTFDLKWHKDLAREISIELEKHLDWNLSDCKRYIHDKIKGQEINESGTFSGLLNLIQTLEMTIIKQNELSTAPALLQENFQTDAKLSASIHGFLGKKWANFYTMELHGLLYDLSKPYVRITNEDIDKIKILVRKGALLHQPIQGRTILECAFDVHLNSWFTKDWSCVKAIIEAASEGDKAQGQTLQNFFLHKAVLYGQDNLVDSLLQNGADFNNDYVTIATANNNKRILELLAQYNPNSQIGKTQFKKEDKNMIINPVNKVSYWSFLNKWCTSSPTTEEENPNEERLLSFVKGSSRN